MTTKHLLRTVADRLPDDATMLDAINDLELLAALQSASIDCIQATNTPTNRTPAWLYESPARLSTVLHQMEKAR